MRKRGDINLDRLVVGRELIGREEWIRLFPIFFFRALLNCLTSNPPFITWPRFHLIQIIHKIRFLLSLTRLNRLNAPLLTAEDFAYKVFNCGYRTICRDLKYKIKQLPKVALF